MGVEDGFFTDLQGNEAVEKTRLDAHGEEGTPETLNACVAANVTDP